MSLKTTIKNKEDFVAGVNELAKMRVRLAKLEASRDLEIQRVQERHSPEIEALDEETSEIYEAIRIYAEDHRDEVFPDKETKTGRTELALYRFYNTPPKIALLNRKFDDARAISLMKACALAPFVRPKEEIDRQSLLAAISEGNITPAALNEVGLKVATTEKFEVNPLADSGEKIAA